MDVSGAYPVFKVQGIITPYGLLRDSIPIPGAIILKMAESINEMGQAYSPTIAVGPPTVLTFIVNEGQGFSHPQAVGVTNIGNYGSILCASLSSSAPYLAIHPSTLGRISVSESASFDVTVNSAQLTVDMNPVAATIILQDPRATNNLVTFPVEIVVLPKAHIVLSPVTLAFYATHPPQGMHYPPVPAQQFSLMNQGATGSVLDYQIEKLHGCTPWLSNYSPPVGEVVGGATQPITVGVCPSINMNPGTYTETLRVSGYSDNYHADIIVQLVIS